MKLKFSNHWFIVSILSHFVLMGPIDTPFVGGLYHGIMQFTEDYPVKAPVIYILTPNGRFRCNANLYEDWDEWSGVNTVSSILASLWSAFFRKKRLNALFGKLFSVLKP